MYMLDHSKVCGGSGIPDLIGDLPNEGAAASLPEGLGTKSGEQCWALLRSTDRKPGAGGPDGARTSTNQRWKATSLAGKLVMAVPSLVGGNPAPKDSGQHEKLADETTGMPKTRQAGSPCSCSSGALALIWDFRQSGKPDAKTCQGSCGLVRGVDAFGYLRKCRKYATSRNDKLRK